jgi:hypothetical protein
MNRDRIKEYLQLLERELKARGLSDKDTLAEMESHLLDSVDQGLSRGLEPVVAQQDALERFGSPRRVANQFKKLTIMMSSPFSREREQEREENSQKRIFGVADCDMYCRDRPGRMFEV